MSEEFRKSILNRLPAMEATRAPWADPPVAQVEREEDDEEEELLDELNPLGPRLSKNTASYTPLSASDFFSQALEITPPGNDATFRAYLTPPQPGSSSGQNPHGTYLVTHHGAGASGLSFAALAKEVKERSPDLGVLAYDARGHGKTRVEGPPERSKDLSLETLTNDLVGIVEHMFPDPKASPSLLLMGHSMGSAPVLGACPILQKKGYTIPGVVVLDVVEGTAVEALPLMKNILGQRPTSFPNVGEAIQWHLQSGLIRNPGSARVSVPSYVVPAPGSSGIDEKQVWRIELLETEPYWLQWYEGLSSRFLTARCARLLVLAGQERLDRDLMVGQMQGKFQLNVMQDVGHYLHEDDPATLAAVLIAFWRRNTQVLVLPPKVGSAAGTPAVAVKQVGEQ